MIKLFCKHEWEQIAKHEVNLYETDKNKMPYETRLVFVQRCKKCGKIKKQTIKL